jgi:transposase
MTTKIKEISFKGQNVYLGIDAHLKNWKVTIMLEHSLHKTLSQDADARILADYLKRNFPGGNYLSAYEAGFCGYSIHRQLEIHGIKNIVVNPADIPTTDKEKKQKEDKRDSLKIAMSLRSGTLKGIYIPSKATDELRGLIRYRKTIVKEVSRNKNRVKSYLYYHGVTIPKELDTASKYWSGKFTKWLETIQMDTPEGSLTLKYKIETTLLLRDKLAEITKQMRQITINNRYEGMYNLLRSIPGIGMITALVFISEIETISRFRKFDTLCSYVGLIPTTHSSGNNEKIGGITSRANNCLRNQLIESAWIASRIDPALILSYNELCKRMKPNEAIVRIAKKILNRIRYVLKNETEYVYSVV